MNMGGQTVDDYPGEQRFMKQFRDYIDPSSDSVRVSQQKEINAFLNDVHKISV